MLDRALKGYVRNAISALESNATLSVESSVEGVVPENNDDLIGVATSCPWIFEEVYVDGYDDCRQAPCGSPKYVLRENICRKVSDLIIEVLSNQDSILS